ncbi:DUF2190 family protein [Caenispirillum bisanense]|uniref:DUF2190 family protein n=1 Tax=Caenispirillum bisanense TaxID=414052 RepID=UPI0031DC284F
MRNFVQAGSVLTLPAPYAVASGTGFLVGSLFAVAASDAATGAEVEGCTQGVYLLPKVAGEAWAIGAKVYWDDAAKTCTTVATDNTLIGVAVQAGAGSTGTVRLNGVVA